MTVWTGGDLGKSHGNSFRIFLQLVEHSVVAELEHEVQLPLPPEHLDQVHKVRVLQVLQHPDLPERRRVSDG